jgi:uncharacterized protein YegL
MPVLAQETLELQFMALPNPTRDIDGATISAYVTSGGEPIEGAHVEFSFEQEAPPHNGFDDDDDPDTPPVAVISGTTNLIGEFQAHWGYYDVCIIFEQVITFHATASKEGYISVSDSCTLTVLPVSEAPYSEPLYGEVTMAFPSGPHKVYVTLSPATGIITSGQTVYFDIQIGREIDYESIEELDWDAIWMIPGFKNTVGFRSEADTVTVSLPDTHEVQAEVIEDEVMVEVKHSLLSDDWIPISGAENLNNIISIVEWLDRLHAISKGDWIGLGAGFIPDVIATLATALYGEELGHGPEGKPFDPNNENVELFPLAFGVREFGVEGFRIRLPVKFLGEGSIDVSFHVAFAFVSHNQYVLNYAGAQFEPLSFTVTIDRSRSPTGKGVWIWLPTFLGERLGKHHSHITPEESAEVLSEVVTKVESMGAKWVIIKFGDSDSWYGGDSWCLPWVSESGISQFHNAGVKVFGWHFVYSYDNWGYPDSEADVSSKILDIKGIDGLVINAEEHWYGKVDEAEIYLESIRQKHAGSFIAYSTFGNPDDHAYEYYHPTGFPYRIFGKYCDVAMPQTCWIDWGLPPEEALEIMNEQWHRLYSMWEKDYSDSIKPIIPTGYCVDKTGAIPAKNGEIAEFCRAVYQSGYRGISIYRYGKMQEEHWEEYANVPSFPSAKNVDVVLLIDRSGSMQGTKIEDAKTSAGLFTDLMHTRDYIGVVSYSDNVRVDYQLSQIASTDIKETVKDKIDYIDADGSTAMGDGLRAAYNQLVNHGNPTHPCAVVLMSDGLNNSGTEQPGDVLEDLKSKSIRVYTVGLGGDVNGTLLEMIARDTRGFYRFAAESGDLMDVYQDIAATVTQEQTVNLASGSILQGETAQVPVMIDSSVFQATFLLSWSGSDLDLILIRPDGSPITPANASSDLYVEYIGETRYEMYRMKYPLVGSWTMNVVGVSVPVEGEAFVARCLVMADIVLRMSTDRDGYDFHQQMQINATIEDSGNLIRGAIVESSVTCPDGSDISTVLFDDGSSIHGDQVKDDGIYTNYFREYTVNGSYIVRVTASGTSLTGEHFVRQTHKTVSASGGEWDYTFSDSCRGTMLIVDTKLKLFQFITMDRDYGIKNATDMQIGRTVTVDNSITVGSSIDEVLWIMHEDTELRLTALAFLKQDLCCAKANDLQTDKSYNLIKWPWRQDVNKDGKVNIQDINIVAKNFGRKSGGPSWNEDADIDENGQINIADISRVAKDYGKTV